MVGKVEGHRRFKPCCAAATSLWHSHRNVVSYNGMVIKICERFSAAEVFSAILSFGMTLCA